MASANINKRYPLSLANNSVLNPIIKHKAKIISAEVAKVAINGIKLFGINGFISCVYSRKFSQFPQEEISLLYNPNLSATADRNPMAIASRKKSLIILVFILSIDFYLQHKWSAASRRPFYEL